MEDNIITVGIKTVMDISDVKANVGVLQAQFNKLKLPSGITDKFNQEISKFSSTYEKYQQKMAQGIKTKGDATQTSKYLNEIAREYDNIVKVYSKASGMDLKSMFKIDSGPLKDAATEVERLTKQLANVDIDKTGFKNLGQQLSGILKNSKFSGEHGLINEMIGHFNDGEVEKAKQALQEIQKEVEKRQYATTIDKNGNTVQKPGTYSEANTTAALGLVKQLMTVADQAGIKIQDIQGPLNKATQNFDNLLNKGVNSFKNIGDAAQKEKAAVHGVVEENKNLVNSMASAQQQSQMLSNRVAMYFSLYEIIRKIGDVAKRAFQTVKELDASMTQTAVVTNFSVADMWEKLPQYTATANQLGSTIKDVYDATTLYYQQGLNTNQAMGIATETLKMARIAGIEAAEATDMMTAALRGFNMQINEVSASRINDVYSKLAAITASNTEELGSAMTRTASIAHSAGMEFETTSAFLSQMIETTREAPENLGTAMKTIIARFQEMKKSPEEFIDEEGNVTSINRVDTALRSVGVSLTDTQGNFRKLDDVFLDLASRWDTLSQGQQRYVATMAAGSRQQSRFIAMMSNYERTMELVDAANNSAGASQEQFNKTLESMDTKLNKLKNAWDQFAMGLTNSTILKGGIDALTGGITIINKFIDVIGKISPKPFENINKSLVTLIGTLSVLRLGGAAVFKHQGILGGLLAGGAGFFQGKDFKSIGAQMQEAFQAQQPVAVAQGNKYGNAFISGLRTSFLNLKGGAADSLTNALNLKIQQGFAKSAPQMRTTLEQVFHTSMQKANISGAKLPNVVHTWQQQLSQLEAGQTDISHVTDVMRNLGVELDTNTLKAQLFTNAITTAGAQISTFGSVLSHIPGLEGFGMILMQIGGLLSTFGETLGVAANAAKAAAAASLADSAAKGTEAAATIGAAIAQGHFIVATKAAGAALKAFWVSLGPIGWAITAIIALAGAVKLLDLAIETDSEKLDSLQDRASAASDRFSEMKQATTELTDSLDKLAEYDTAFESLVSGTAEFNQQLLESNELVTELIKKYPSLEQNGYVTTDANGRMNISQAGREEILKEQQEKQAKAQAIDIFANADYKRQQAIVSSEYKKAEQMEQKVWNEIGSSFVNLTFDEKRVKILEEMAARGEKSTADIIAKADAASAMARKQAVTSLISSQKDLIDKDSVAEVMATNYDQLIESIEADTSGEERAKAYAEANGLEYIKGNKFRNAEGEEVEVEKDVWNDETTNKRIKANNQMIDSAGQVDQALMHLNSAAQEVFSGLDSNSLITDILSNNVNTNRDDLVKLLDSGELSKLVSQMSETDIEALKAAGIEDAQAFIEERAKAIQEAQAQQDVDLAARMARATNADVDWFSDVRSEGLVNDLKKQLDSLTQAERSFATTTSQSLEDAFDVNVADDFVKTYTQGSKEVREEYSAIFKDVDWTSSISALGAMQSALESNVDEVKQLGQLMKDSVAGSHLLNDALQEMSVAEDFQKAMENLDNFVDESGRLSAVGIQKMAEESGTLAKMLDTGALSAGGLAAAINATSIDGTIAITDLSDSVLELLQYFGQLDDAIASAHDYIENFNPGIDTGESKDFITENVKKAKEFAANGEWGNEQFINYIQSVIGTERWQDVLKSVGGNTEKAYHKIEGYLNGYSQGYDKMWMNLVNKTDVTGKDITKKVDKNLRDITMTYDKNGDLQLDLAGHSIEDFNKFLQQAEGVTKEQADLMIEDWKNYSYDFAHEWETNKFQTALKDTNYIEQHRITDENGKTIGTSITQSEIDTLAAATGKDAKEIAAEIGKALGIEINKNENGSYGFANKDKEGNLRTDYQQLASDFNKYLGLNKNQLFANQGQFANEQGTGYDIQKIIQGYIEKGFTEVQAQNMTFEQMKSTKGKEYTYNGEVIDPKAFDSFASMAEQFAEIDQNVQWEAIGQSIAKGLMEGIEKGESETGTSENTNPSITKAEEKGQKAAEEGSETANGLIIKGLQTQIKTLETDIDKKEKDLQAARDELAEAQAEAKKAKTDKDNAEKEVSKAQKKVDELTGQLNDLKTEHAAALAELNKYRPQGEQKGTSKAQGKEETTAEVTVKYKVDTKELEKAEEKVKALKKSASKGVKVKISTPGAGKLKTAFKNISALQKAAAEGGVSTEVNVKSKDDGGVGVKAIKKAATSEKGAIVKVSANTSFAETKVNQLVHNINNKNATINISPNFGPSTDWEKAVKVKVRVRKGGKIDDNKGGSVHQPKSGGRAIKYATGGSALTAFVPEGTDTVPAMLTPGEFVQRRKAVNYFGDSFMEHINQLNLKAALKTLNKKQLLGSMAKGSRSHGMLGPKNRGGLTLTGEEGYEVAWVPSENRSMILGVNGPEMLDLPKDTVVWNHQKSQDIIKKKNIPGGTAAIGAGSLSGRHVTTTTTTKVTKGEKTTEKENKKNSSKSGKTYEKIIKQTWKLLGTAGKITNWWENISRRVTGTQRLVNKNQKELEKKLGQIGSTFNDIKGTAKNYRVYLQQSISLNKEIVNKYTKQLDKLTSGKGQSKVKRKDAVDTINKRANAVTKAEAKIELAKQTKSKKDDKKAKSQLKKAKTRLKNAKKKDKSAAVDTVTYDDEIQVITTKKTKKGKKGKWSKPKKVKSKKKVKSTRAVDWSKIIKYDEKSDTWVLDDAAINKAAGGNKKAAKAIKEKGNKLIDEKIQRRNAAQDKIDEAREALNKLSEDLYDTFLGWENELTKIYMLSKKIESAGKITETLESAQSLRESMLKSGLQNVTKEFAADSVSIFGSIMSNNLSIIKMNDEQIKNQRQAVLEAIEPTAIQDRIKEISNLIQQTINQEKLGMYNKALEKAQEDLVVANQALKYVSSIANGDGTFAFNFDENQLNKDILAGKINESTGKAITKRINKMIEESDNLAQLYAEQLSTLQNMYDTLADLRKQYADYADELVEAIDNASQEEIDRFSKLNDSLTNNLKNLLDEVKRRLDQRRQQEDNAKTESDIAKKQQRLATLQADTSGGHATEIAQLQQEIAEAQQTYGRTLEDQALQRLEEQADEAAKQRERIIALMEAAAELSKETGNNIAKVNEYLSNPTAYKDEIQELWRQNNDYYNQTTARQDVMDSEFETFFEGISIIPEEMDKTTVIIESMQEPLQNMSETVGALVTSTGGVSTTLDTLATLSGETKQAIVDGLNAIMGSGVASISDVVTAVLGIYSGDETSLRSIIEGLGLTIKDLYKAGISAEDVVNIFGEQWTEMFKAGFNFDQLKEADATTKDLVKVAEETAKQGQSTGASYQAKAGTSSQVTQQALTEAGITQASAMAGVTGKMDVNGNKKGGEITTHINEKGTYEVGNKGSTVYFQEYDKEKGIGTGKITSKTVDKLTEGNAKNNPVEVKQAIEYAITHQKAGTKINKDLGKIAKALGINRNKYTITTDAGNSTTATLADNGNIYWNTKEKGIKKWDTSSGKVSVHKSDAALKKLKKVDRTALKTSSIWREYKAWFDAHKLSYLSGGMDYTTGPAWLDGTRAKPEAVLNATETKNFIALKDILSDVIGHINNSESTTYGDSTWEININVDHLNNDYDVDKVAKRVEKIITDNASYRNVTMVRKFR